MGLKLNKFSTFAALCNNDDPVVNRFFDSFKLTAILLCDQSDQSFINEINRNFDRLSDLTGEGLLFISFTKLGNSIPSVGKFAHRSLGMTEGEIDCLREALSADTTLDRMNLSELARQFHVDVKQLPVIVLTNTIKSDRALIIPTNSNDVGYQLSQLAYLANDPDYDGSLEAIQVERFGPYTQEINFKTAIANILTDVLARLRLRVIPSDREAVKWNNKAVHENIRRLHEMADSDETLQDREDELMEYSFNRIAPISIPDNNVLYPFQIAEEKMKGSEDDTLVMLNTYNLFSTLLDANGEIQRHDPVHGFRRYDYSALSVCLGKMFENELSYSIVQLMRQCVGIPMPKYYAQFYNSPQQFVVAKVDLNSSTKKKDWKAPSIGDAKVAYEQLKIDFNDPNVLGLDPDYEALWDELKMGRNKASHRNPIDSRGFKNTYKKFCRFLDDGFFGRLISIKEQLRGL